MVAEIQHRKKVDITEHVHGEFHGDHVTWYVDEREIGRLNLAEQTYHFDFKEGYGLEAAKIYQIQEEGIKDDQYVEGCDMGWC